MAYLLSASGTFLQGVAESVVFAIIVFTSLIARIFGPARGGRVAESTAQPPRPLGCEKHEDDQKTETEVAMVPCPLTPRNALVNQKTDIGLSTPQSQIFMVGMGPNPGTPLQNHPTTMVVATCTTSPPSSTPMRPRNLEESLLLVAQTAGCTASDKDCDGDIAVDEPSLWETEDNAQDMVQAIPKEEPAAAAATMPTCLTPSSPPLSFRDVPKPNLFCAIEKAHVRSDGELPYYVAAVKASTPSVDMGAAAPTVARPVNVAAGGILRGGYEDEMLENSIPQPIFASPFKNGIPAAADEPDCTEVGVPQAKSALAGTYGSGKASDVQGVLTPLEAFGGLPDTPQWPTAAVSAELHLEPCCTLPGHESSAEQDASPLMEQCTGVTLSDASLAVQELLYSPTMSTPAPFASAVTIAVDAVSNTVARNLQGDQGATSAETPCGRRSSKMLNVSLEPVLAAAATAPHPQPGIRDKAPVLGGPHIPEPGPVTTISTPPALQHAHCSCCHSVVEVLGAAKRGVPRYAAPTVSSLARQSPRAAHTIAAQRTWDSQVGPPGVQSYTPERLSMRRTMVSPFSLGSGGRGAAASAGNGSANVMRRRGGMSGQLPN